VSLAKSLGPRPTSGPARAPEPSRDHPEELLQVDVVLLDENLAHHPGRLPGPLPGQGPGDGSGTMASPGGARPSRPGDGSGDRPIWGGYPAYPAQPGPLLFLAQTGTRPGSRPGSRPGWAG